MLFLLRTVKFFPPDWSIRISVAQVVCKEITNRSKIGDNKLKVEFLEKWSDQCDFLISRYRCFMNRPFYSCVLMNESEAGVDLVLIETSLLFLCKFLLISMTTTSLTLEKEGSLYHNKVNTSLTFI